MPLPTTEANQLRAILRRFSGAFGPGAIPIAQGKALEAWLMMRLAHKAYRSGRWRVTFVGSDDNQLATGRAFVFPASQQGIPAKAPGGPDHVRLEDLSDPSVVLELHSSIRWLGRSGTTHELDVSLLPEHVSGPLRRNGGGEPRGLPIAAYECKDKNSSGSADEMRQTLARLFDMALVTMPYPGWGCRMFETRTHRRWGSHRKRYRDFYSTGAFGVVRAGGLARGGRLLGAHYSIGRHGNVYTDVRSITAAERAFLEAIDRAPTI